MKTVYSSLMMIALVAMVSSCSKVSYKKTKSGLLYKINSTTKDSLVKDGDWMKLHFVQKLNDSVLQTSYGKMPVYVKITSDQKAEYSPAEIFHLLRKGDSVLTVMMVDSLLKKNLMQELPPFMKKGDKITTGFKVTEVFHNDSTYQLDAKAEFDKDQPRQLKEQKEQEAKQTKERLAEQEKEQAELEKNGEAAKGVKAMEAYLASKNIQAQKAGKGTFVVIKEPGTGAQAAPGKFVTVKYDGKHINTDSTFDAGTFTRELGVAGLIIGMEDGLAAFKEGGKGTLYIPGFRAYGNNPNPQSPFKPMEPLKFEIELLGVSDTLPKQQQAIMPPRRN